MKMNRVDDDELTPYDVLVVLSNSYWGKQYYFEQDDGMIYSRDSGKYMTLEDAVIEFAERIGDD